jgi:hypothetical protein
MAGLSWFWLLFIDTLQLKQKEPAHGGPGRGQLALCQYIRGQSAMVVLTPRRDFPPQTCRSYDRQRHRETINPKILSRNFESYAHIVKAQVKPHQVPRLLTSLQPNYFSGSASCPLPLAANFSINLL